MSEVLLQVFMLGAGGFLLGLTIYCFYLVLTSKDEDYFGRPADREDAGESPTPAFRVQSRPGKTASGGTTPGDVPQKPRRKPRRAA